MRAALERHCNSVWYEGRQPGPFLRTLERLYRLRLGNRWHRPPSRPAIPVIVVGNLTVGGGGKTPVVMALARHLAEAGRAVAVISRGYGGKAPGEAWQVTGDSDPQVAGDEPVLIANSSQVPVWVCARRAAAFEAALDAGAEVVVADDGLQHAALARSFEICVVDGLRGFGNDRLLPAGPLRQPRQRLEEVDIVLVKGGGLELQGAMEFDLCPDVLVSLDGSRRAQPHEWAGRRVSAACGIANPDGFFASLAELEILASQHPYPDHHRFVPADIDRLKGPVIVTAKDAVKLQRLDLAADVWVLEVSARLPNAVFDTVDCHVQDYCP
ncbi:MAG: tetraacyldisaccharide 4'-kinase [Wenzhouxiangella sp.]